MVQYFTDGLDGLIRVHTDAPRRSREFFFAKAEKLGDDDIWHRQSNLVIEILNNGYYWPLSSHQGLIEEIGPVQ